MKPAPAQVAALTPTCPTPNPTATVTGNITTDNVLAVPGQNVTAKRFRRDHVPHRLHQTYTRQIFRRVRSSGRFVARIKKTKMANTTGTTQGSRPSNYSGPGVAVRVPGSAYAAPDPQR